MITVSIKDIIKSPLAVSSEDAEKLYSVLRKELQNGHKIELSFDGISDFISSFLNAAIGRLYNNEFSYEILDKDITVNGLDESDMGIYISVVERAKSYYKDPHHFDEVKEELDNEK
jgi:hypothetical protein